MEDRMVAGGSDNHLITDQKQLIDDLNKKVEILERELDMMDIHHQKQIDSMKTSNRPPSTKLAPLPGRQNAEDAEIM